jgi:hypothetical protein
MVDDSRPFLFPSRQEWEGCCASLVQNGKMAAKEAPMVELTEQQQQALDAGLEIRLVDPLTKTSYTALSKTGKISKCVFGVRSDGAHKNNGFLPMNSVDHTPGGQYSLHDRLRSLR